MTFGPLSSVAAGLADLILPRQCAGCGADAAPRGVCRDCVADLAALRPHPTRPQPSPVGLPPCAALGDYDGALRGLILAYKERGRHPLARPLGRLLASVVASLLPAVPVSGAAAGAAVVLVPIPDTPAAARARHGDHLWRLARPAAARLREAGIPVHLARPLRAGARPDSAGLDRAARAASARTSLRPRPRRAASLRRRLVARPASVILLDDVVTTGATLAAATARLTAAGIPVSGAAVLAATRRRRPGAAGY